MNDELFNKIEREGEYRGIKVEFSTGINNPFPYSIPDMAPAWFKSLDDLVSRIDKELQGRGNQEIRS